MSNIAIFGRERLVIGQRFYAAGLQAYNSSDWHTAADNLATALHLQLYPYLGSNAAMRAWQSALASSDAGSVALRAWTGQLLLAYAKAQYASGQERNDINAVDLGYLASDGAIAVLNSVVDIVGFGAGQYLEASFQKDVNEFALELAEARILRRSLATMAAQLLARAREPDLVQALLPRRGNERKLKTEFEMIHALAPLLNAPVKVLCCGDEIPNSGSSSDGGVVESTKVSGVPHVVADDYLLDQEEKAWKGLSPLDALHAAAMVAAHAVRDGLRREVGVECWDNVSSHQNMPKCREAVTKLWTGPWDASEKIILDVPNPSSLLTSLQLLQSAMLQLNQVLPGTALGMKHESGAVIVKNSGFQWQFMEFYFSGKLNGGTGEGVASLAATTAVVPPPGAAAGTPVVCVDYSMLQNSLLLLNETSLSDLSGSLQNLSAAQGQVGGPLLFWDMVSAGSKSAAQYKEFLAPAAGESAASPGGIEEMAARLDSSEKISNVEAYSMSGL